MVSTFLAMTFLATISITTTNIAAANDDSTTLLLSICRNDSAAVTESFNGNFFVEVMDIIHRKITSTGFGISEYGTNISNRVYGLGQCLNYLSNSDCQLCYSASRVKLPQCLPATSARVYLNGCFLRYGNYNFFQEALDNLDSSDCRSSGNVTDEAKFRDITNGLIQNLTLGAYEETEYYKQGNASVSSDVTVYGVAQCWRSLNKSGCKECLESAGEKIVDCLPGSEGKALYAGCFLRYSLEPFYLAQTPPNTGSSSVGRHLGAALGSIFAAVVVIGAAILWRRRRSSSGYYFSHINGSLEIPRTISESHLCFKYDDLRKATKNFDLQNKLGQGGYGIVYKGILSDGREIAVKRLFFNSTQWLDQFFNEVSLISRVQHKHLVKLYGCSVDGPESLLVYEYLCNTSLDKFLFDSFRKNDLHWERRFGILVGTAKGLAYLHTSSEVRIIHRDIKASNVLLDERFMSKIADFGLARYFAEGQSHLSTGVAGTLGYMAPEYVVHGQLTEKADVYSYGILVLEVVTGRKNTTSLSSSTESHSLTSQIWRHFTSNTAIEMLDPNLKGQCSEEQVLKVFHVGLLCTQASPNLRPPMWKVVEMLMSENDLPLPTKPPFLNIMGVERRSSSPETPVKVSSSYSFPTSANQISVSIEQGR